MMRSLGVMKDKDCKKQGKTQRSKYEVRGTRYESYSSIRSVSFVLRTSNFVLEVGA